MWYAIVRDADGALLSTGSVVGDLPAGVVSIELGNEPPSGDWDPLQRVFVPATVPPRLSRYAFRKRFTDAEKIALEIASLDNPNAPMEQRAQAALLRAYLKDVDAAQFVDLSHPVTRGGVQMLESSGLISVGRATQILDTPVSADERAGA